MKEPRTVYEKGWWEKPVGIVALAVCSGMILWGVTHYFEKAWVTVAGQSKSTVQEEKPDEKSNRPAMDAPGAQPRRAAKMPRHRSPLQSNPITSSAAPSMSQACALGASCAMSNGQQGGITAGQIIETPLVRQLTDSQKQGIAFFLQTIPQSVLITVGSVYGSGDGDIYANQFFPLFAGRHYDRQSAPSIRTGFSPEFTGIFVATTTEDDPATPYRDAFAQDLRSVGINARVSNGSKVARGNLELLIGYRPEEVKRPQ